MKPNEKGNVPKTIWINDELFDRIKRTAKEQQKTASAYIAAVLTDLLENPLYIAVRQHARRDGMTPEEYIRAAIVDKIAFSAARRKAEKEIEKAVQTAEKE